MQIFRVSDIFECRGSNRKASRICQISGPTTERSSLSRHASAQPSRSDSVPSHSSSGKLRLVSPTRADCPHQLTHPLIVSQLYSPRPSVHEFLCLWTRQAASPSCSRTIFRSPTEGNHVAIDCRRLRIVRSAAICATIHIARARMGAVRCSFRMSSRIRYDLRAGPPAKTRPVQPVWLWERKGAVRGYGGVRRSQ